MAGFQPAPGSIHLYSQRGIIGALGGETKHSAADACCEVGNSIPFEKHDPMNPPIRKYGVVAVVVRDDRFLVIRRSQQVRAPGMYCFPGGGIEANEAEPTAVQREMLEELSATVQPVRRLWHYVTSWGVDLAWWLVELPLEAELLQNPAEVEEFFWLTVAEIRALPKLLESNGQFLDALERGEFVIEGLSVSQAIRP